MFFIMFYGANDSGTPIRGPISVQSGSKVTLVFDNNNNTDANGVYGVPADTMALKVQFQKYSGPLLRSGATLDLFG